MAVVDSDGAERDERVPLLASVDRTVAALSTTDADAAAVHLAQLLAQQIDRAAALAAYASRTARDVQREHGDESALYERVQALQAKVSERDTLDRIGARLAALLVELKATPRSRGKDGAAPPEPAPGSALRGLRAAKGATA